MTPPGCVIRRDEPLARHLPWRVGGPCEAWVVVHHRDAVPEALAWCKEENLKPTWLGAGTRTVVRDAGLSGAVLRLGVGFQALRQGADGLVVGAALPMAALAAPLGRPDLLRVPGSVGASLLLDPGWGPWVASVRYVTRGKERSGDLDALRAAASTAVVVEATLRLADAPAPGPEEPGGWYEPTEGGGVGEVILEAALGDTRLRQVAVPAATPELLVNLGGATAADLSLLQRSVIDRVFKLRGVQLVDRMRWLGRTG